MIHLSKAAISEIRRMYSHQQKLDAKVRVGIQTGGCADFFYTIEFDQTVNADDNLYDYSGISILIDSQSIRYLTGLTIDYSEDLMGGGFRFHNPNAVESCGCGNSFTASTESQV
jgi:iron-sulfur cluster assembly protein